MSSTRRLAAQIPGADLAVLARAGHLLPLQHPGHLAEIIVGTATREDRDGHD